MKEIDQSEVPNLKKFRLRRNLKSQIVENKGDYVDWGDYLLGIGLIPERKTSGNHNCL